MLVTPYLNSSPPKSLPISPPRPLRRFGGEMGGER